MNFASIATLSICILGSACIGLWFLPFCAHRMLVFKHQQIHEYWLSCLSEYRALDNCERIPKALELWIKDCQRLALDCALPREYAARLNSISPSILGTCNAETLPSFSQRKETYCGELRVEWRIASAIVFAAVSAILVASGISRAVAVVLWCALAYCIILALIDAKAHILPYEMTLGLLPLGACTAATLILCDVMSWQDALIGAALYALVLFGAAGITHFVTKLPATGQGDIRATPGFALLCCAFPLEALAATSVSMAIAFIILRITKRLSLTDSIAFGPFLTIGLATGIVLFCLGFQPI